MVAEVWKITGTIIYAARVTEQIAQQKFEVFVHFEPFQFERVQVNLKPQNHIITQCNMVHYYAVQYGAICNIAQTPQSQN